MFYGLLLERRDRDTRMEKATAYSDLADSSAAGLVLGQQLMKELSGSPDAIIVFAAPSFDHAVLLEALSSKCPGAHIVGSSSAGEFTHSAQGEGSACALALKSEDVHFAVGIGRDLHVSAKEAANQIASTFRGVDEPTLHRAALVMTDALSGHAPDLIHELMLATKTQYQLFGGGAGDNAAFSRTVVFNGTEVLENAAVALEMISKQPIGVGVGHGWEPAADAMRVTEADGLRLIGLDGMPAVEAFEAHAEDQGQALDRDAPLPFFLHNILGVETVTGYQLRMPLSVDKDGALHMAGEVPVGSRVRIMRTSLDASLAATTHATSAALSKLNGQKPGVALFFDCAATKIRIGDQYTMELEAVRSQLHDLPMVGCITQGQFGRAEGQYDGFHNCTAVVCVLPA